MLVAQKNKKGVLIKIAVTNKKRSDVKVKQIVILKI